MADLLHIEIVSPERLLKEADVAMVVVPGAEGDFGVLPDHAPFMSTIRPGVVGIFETDGADAERLFLKGGLAQVAPSGLTILAEEAIALDAVDSADLDQKISDIKEDIEDAKDDRDLARLEKELGWMSVLKEEIS